MIVDGDKNVVSINWAYSNAEGILSNQLKLAQPYGKVALAKVDEELAISWLEDQLQNTAEEFDAAIAKRKAEAEYDQTLMPYQPNPSGPPTPITMPILDEDIEQVTAATTKTKKAKK